MKNKTNLIIIFCIFALGLFLRTYGLSSLPHGFNADEAAIGYNVYSLLQTGRDEHGHPWPLHFQSFNDYKPGGYFYLALPFIALLGPTELAVRLPSLLAGLAAIILIFFLARELNLQKKLPAFPFLAAFFLAISPWHIEFSRGGWETNVATTFLLFAAYLFLKGQRQNKFSLQVFSLLCFVASGYIYHSPRVIAPLLLGFLILSQTRAFFKNKKQVFVFLFLGVLLTAPVALSFLKGGAAARFSGVGFSGDIGPEWYVNRARGEHGSAVNTFWVRILHNRPLAQGLKIAQKWFSHFGGQFLFIDGDNIARSHAPGLGQFYYLDLVFLLAGLIFIITKKEKSFLFPLFWLLIAPLPAALTIQSPHALRAHSMLIPFLLIAAYGAAYLFQAIRPKKFALTWLSLIAFLLIWQVSYFADRYFVHYSQNSPAAWESGFSELAEYLAEVGPQYEKVYFTERYDQPYILLLFYLRYPPSAFQKEAVLTPRDKFGFSTVRDFANFHFENFAWDSLPRDKKSLVVGASDEIPQNAHVLRTILFPSGEIAFKIAEL